MIQPTRKRLESLIWLALHPAVPPGPPIPTTTELTVSLAFTFTTSSPLVLSAVAPGYKFNRAVLLVEAPFDDPSATLSVGTSGDPGLLLRSADCRLDTPNQYESDALVVIAVPDVLLLSLHAGASTQGAGLLLYKVLLP
jgi:hypothetical protein